MKYHVKSFLSKKIKIVSQFHYDLNNHLPEVPSKNLTPVQ